MTDVVKQSGIGDQLFPFPDLLWQAVPPPQEPKGRRRQVVHPQGVVETGMGRPGIYEMSQPELPYVSEALKGSGVHDADRRGIHSDTVPERISDDSKAIVSWHGPTVAPGDERSNGSSGPGVWLRSGGSTYLGPKEKRKRRIHWFPTQP
jgi:hypothetical protein